MVYELNVLDYISFNMRQFISYLDDRKIVLLCPKGLSFEQMMDLNEKLSPKTDIYLEGNHLKTTDSLSDSYDLELLEKFSDYQKMIFIKNPYWRVLQVYLWNFLYASKISIEEVYSFKKTLKSIYIGVGPIVTTNKKLISEMKCQSYEHELVFKSENYNQEMMEHFNIQTQNSLPYFSQLLEVSSNYHRSMNSISEFYDRESAELVYENHKDIFENFGYSFYSYLDFHDPISKIHHLHGDLQNKFES